MDSNQAIAPTHPTPSHPAPACIWADVRTADGAHVQVMQYDLYKRLPLDMVRGTTAHLFVHGAGGERIDLGTLLELVKALGLGRDFSATKVAGGGR